MRSKSILICEECNSRNYSTTKSKLKTQRLELKKYCSKCNLKTLHKESR
ncbi:50S ribosomal protein L33 [Mycoplasmoides pirum]|nr:50S ribosomal protein L33 [Mycoplasmoides pirum]